MNGVFPDQGSYAGGTQVTIVGRHLGGATAVYFGTRPALGLTVIDDRTIVATAPPGNGTLPVIVVTPGGTARVGSFHYLPAPRLAGISPGTGPLAGGNTVDLSGSGLYTARTAYFGNALAFPQVVTDQRLAVAAPPAALPGTVPVHVTAVGGVSNSLPYAYLAAPFLSGASPASGPLVGGTAVIIRGTGLSRATRVAISGVTATSFRAYSDTLILAVTPPGVTGPADVTVTTPGGTVSLAQAFTYMAGSTTAVTSGPDPSVAGQTVTFTATVTGVPAGTGVPSGTVTFDFGDGTPRVTAPLVDGTAIATHAYKDPSGSPYPVTAAYSGATVFLPSSGADTHTVTQAATTTALSSLPDPSAVGEPAAFVARVTPVEPGAGSPTGSVVFDFGDGTAPLTVPLSAGAATVTHAFTEATDTAYPVTATYSGDGSFSPSTDADTQTVERAAAAIRVTVTPIPSAVGEPVTVTAAVTAVPPGVATATGTVTVDFGDGTTPVAVPLIEEVAEVSHSYTGAAGSPYTVTVAYSGNAHLAPTTITSSQSVTPAVTTTTVVPTPDLAAVGETVLLTATVDVAPPGSGTPSGTVTFDFGDGTAPITAPLTGGTAEAEHAYVTATGSPYAVTAAYHGDPDFLPSLGAGAQAITPATTTTAVVSPSGTAAVGETVVFTATVGVAPPGSGTPSGTVTFDFGDDSGPVTAVLTAGTAEAEHVFIDATVMPYQVTATYNGDPDFLPSTGSDTQAVEPAATTTFLLSAPDPAPAGQTSTFVAQVVPAPPAADSPTGTVTFDFGTSTLQAPVVGGTATVTRTNPGAADSPYTVTATYSGDTNFTPSTGSDSQTVIQAVSLTTVNSSPGPSMTGQEVTFTATMTATSGSALTPSGAVTFDFGDGTAPVTVVLADATAKVVHAYTSAVGSPYTVTATYSGDTDFSGSTGSRLHTVDPAETTTTVTTAPDPSVTGESVSVAVTPVTPADGTPTGTVTLDFGDGSRPVTAVLVDGSATVVHSYNSAASSPFTITATYSGDANFDPSQSTVVHTVTPDPTTTTVTSSAEPSAVGQTVTFFVQVAPGPPGAGTPTGTVSIDFGDGTAPATTPLTGGVATVTHAYNSTAASPYMVTAAYGGDADFSASTGTTTQRVEADVSATTTTLVSSPDPSSTGQQVTFTATVTAVPPAAGTPAGTVTFAFGDGTAPVTAPLDAGVATVAHTYTSAAGNPYAVTAVFSSDGDFAGSADTETHTVHAAATTTTVSSAPDPSLPGQPVTFNVTVTPAGGSATPSGTATIDFGDGTPTVTAPITGGSATAVHTYVHASDSPYAVTAVYQSDVSFTGSSGSDSHDVAPAASSITLTTTPEPSLVGQPVTVTATVATVPPASATPTGTITFDFGDGSAPVMADTVGGLAVVTHVFTGTAGGPFTITATYEGNSDVGPAADAANHTVHAASTATLLHAMPDPSVTGQTVSATATVTPVAPGAGTPSGTVSFDFGDGSDPVPADTVGGVAVATHAYAGTRGSPFTITAAYGGSMDFTASLDTETQAVTQNATTTVVTSAPDPSAVGQPVTFTATVAPQVPGTTLPTGTVTFDFGDGSTPAAVPLTGGVATTTHAFATTAGAPYTVIAAYGGNADFTPSSGTDIQLVDRASSATVVTSSAEPSVTGQPVTITASVSAVSPGAGTPGGTVTFDFGDGTAPVTAPLSAGLALAPHAYAKVSGSPFPVTATYSGDEDFTPSAGATPHRVTQAATVTSVATSPAPSVVGQTVQTTATVKPIAPGAGAPTGTVTFAFGDGTEPVTAPLSGGTATVSHPYTNASDTPYIIDAAYNGAADFSSSTGTGTQPVGPASTTTTVGMAPDPSVTGQPVVVTATVTPVAPGDGSPTGTVTLDFGDGSAPVAVPLTGGVATTAHTYPTAAGSPYTVVATYGGSVDFTGSVGSGLETILPAITTTTLSTSPDPSVAGQSVTLTATVDPLAPGAGPPTGTVTFAFGDRTASATVPLTGNTATLTHVYAAASATPYIATATYNGDVDFAGSTGADSQTVGRAQTTATVTSAPDPTVTGQPVTITATVAPTAPGGGLPTGTVTFSFGDGTAPVTATTTAGAATVTHVYATTDASPYRIVATYNGDSDFAASRGNDTQTVTKAATVTQVLTSPAPSAAGQQVTVTARMAPTAPGAGVPTGSVTFDFGDGSPTVTAPMVGGTANTTHVYAGASASSHTVTATYSGDADFSASAGNATHTMSPGAATTTTTITSSPDPSVSGQSVVFTITVTPTDAGAGIPTGTVALTFRPGTPPVTVPLVAGTASIAHTYTGTTASPYTVTAVYSGDADFSSSADTDAQTVQAASTTTALVSAPDPSVTGQPVSFTATVTASGAGAGVPSGTVTYTFGDGTPAVSSPVTNGAAVVSHTYSGTDGSPFEVTATYNGDGSYLPSTGTDTQTVKRASTTTTLTSSPDPSVTGQSVSFTATVAAAGAGAGVPSGTVTYTFGDGTPAVSSPVTNGAAVVSHTYSGTGGSPFGVTATYNGDGSYLPSTGTDTQTVNRASTTTALTSSPDPSVTGQSVSFTATVTASGAGAGVPSGTVTYTFGDGTPAVSSPVTNGAAVVSHTYSGTGGSPFGVTATYNGDGSYLPSTGTDTQTVNRASTTTALVSSPDPSVTGQSVSFTATVTASGAGAGVPSGTVTYTFGDGTTTTTTLTNGTATLTHSYDQTTGSPFAVTATYNGDGNYLPSTGTDTQTVNRASTTTALTSSPDPSVTGQSVSFTATVTASGAGAGVPTGTVTYTFGDGTPAVSSPLTNGAAVVSHTYSGTGGSPFGVTATYNGDGSYLPSTGTDTQTVNRASTTTALVSSPDPSVT
ncbi:Ig-like domain repeat protein, partial [Streptomyces griseoluteus]|uniref:Ig-like domain repeat protein n=1 Tax=Streptomyces griseoluteus TaxID=29306 RepID=UPI0033EEB661